MKLVQIYFKNFKKLAIITNFLAFLSVFIWIFFIGDPCGSGSTALVLIFCQHFLTWQLLFNAGETRPAGDRVHRGQVQRGALQPGAPRPRAARQLPELWPHCACQHLGDWQLWRLRRASRLLPLHTGNFSFKNTPFLGVLSKLFLNTGMFICTKMYINCCS